MYFCKIIITISVILVMIILIILYSKETPFIGAFGELFFNKSDSDGSIRVIEFSRTKNKSILENCENEKCVRKCCPKSRALFFDNDRKARCVESKRTLKFQNSIAIVDSVKEYINFNNSFQVTQGLPCSMKYVIMELFFLHFTDFQESFPWILNEVDRYEEICFDIVEDEDEDEVYGLTCFGDDMDFMYYERRFVSLSPILLFIMFLVFAVIPELRNTTFGLCLMSHVASLFFAYSISAFKPTLIKFYEISLMQDEDEEVVNGYETKIFITYSTYFLFYYAAFFWLNVICFDIWRTFANNKPKAKANLNRKPNIEKLRFLMYSLYAWCIPILCFIVHAFLTEFDVERFDDCSSIGQDTVECSFFYGPIVIVLLVNIFLFFHTIYKIKSVWRQTDQTMVNKKKKVMMEMDYERLAICGKFFTVMGVPYLLEIISFLYAKKLENINLWYFADIVKSLQGLFLLMFVILNKRVLKLLYSRFCLCKRPTSEISTLIYLNTSMKSAETEKIPTGSLKPMINGS